MDAGMVELIEISVSVVRIPTQQQLSIYKKQNYD